MATNKDLPRLLSELERQNFQVTRTGGSHFLIRSPQGEFVTGLASTPSEIRGGANAAARLRRAGFVDPSRLTLKKKGERA